MELVMLIVVAAVLLASIGWIGYGYATRHSLETCDSRSAALVPRSNRTTHIESSSRPATHHPRQVRRVSVDRQISTPTALNVDEAATTEWNLPGPPAVWRSTMVGRSGCRNASAWNIPGPPVVSAYGHQPDRSELPAAKTEHHG